MAVTCQAIPSFLSLAVGQTGRGYGTTSYGGWSLHGSKARRLNALNIPYSGVGGDQLH